MYETLTEKELHLYCNLKDPVFLIENLIPRNIKSPSNWSDTSDCIRLRNYQFAMIAYDYILVNDPKKSEKENRKIRKGSGDIYDIGSRNTGKSLCFDMDAALRIVHGEGLESCISSFDEDHLQRRSEPVLGIVENHKFFQMFHLTGNKKTVSRKPHQVLTRHGHLQVGVNEKVNGKNVGSGYDGLHYDSFSYDEISWASADGTKRRIDSGKSIGYIERLYGIPDIKVGSPLGEILKDKNKAPWIWRLPQFVRPDWDSEERIKRAGEYGGESSLSFKLNVLAEIIEGAYGKWDMERIKKMCYHPEKFIKFFEIGKDLFSHLDIVHSTPEKVSEFQKILSKKIIIDRLPASQIICASDIGTTGSPSEIAILFGDFEDKWKYEYQISVFGLIVKEQALVFKWIYDTLGSCFICLDCTNADGRAIRDELLSLGVPIEHLPDFRMNQNIEVDFEKDDTGKVKRDRLGKPLMKVEYTKVWAIQKLEEKLYNGKVDIPHDDKWLREFNGFFEKPGSGKIPSWGSETTEHLHDTFLLFALCAWQNRSVITQNLKKGKRTVGII